MGGFSSGCQFGIGLQILTRARYGVGSGLLRINPVCKVYGHFTLLIKYTTAYLMRIYGLYFSKSLR